MFTLTLNAAFAIGYALAGPVVVTLVGAPGLILVVAACYLVAAGFCWTLPPSPPAAQVREGRGHLLPETEEAMGSTFAQLREGIEFIRDEPVDRLVAALPRHRRLAGRRAGRARARSSPQDSLGLEPKEFAVVVLPLGFGIVTGILLLNSFGHLSPRRRIIEGGLVALGIFVVADRVRGPDRAVHSRTRRPRPASGRCRRLTSLLAIVVFIALLAGIAYGFVAIPAQTQLQEDIPEDGRGRVFGILNMLVSVSSFLPIIIVGPVSDVLGTHARC